MEILVGVHVVTCPNEIWKGGGGRKGESGTIAYQGREREKGLSPGSRLGGPM